VNARSPLRTQNERDALKIVAILLCGTIAAVCFCCGGTPRSF
jgi:hypothetical protein